MNLYNLLNKNKKLTKYFNILENIIEWNQILQHKY